MTTPSLIPSYLGARFYRCAFQVNPYAYIRNHKKPDTWGSEAAYNAALIKAIKAANIEVIAVTDHHSISDSVGLIHAAEAAGLKVFPGFEYHTSDSVHIICLFEPGTSGADVQDKLSQLGIPPSSPPMHGKVALVDLLTQFHEWRDSAICFAAHACATNGILSHLPAGAGRMNAWKHPNLMAISLAGPVDECPAEFLRILRNQDPQYRRERLPAILSASDLSTPADASKASVSSWIKMSDVSVEALRQAFLDPVSRVRRDLPQDRHPCLEAINWTGGFFDGLHLAFSENLNAAIGGRGAGKSTLIEAIRSVLGLEVIGSEARANHDGILRQNLGGGTAIRLVVRVTKPAEKLYVIERIGLNSPQVFDAEDLKTPLQTSPGELLRGVQVFGQHEISEIARDSTKRTELLRRFMADSDDAEEKKRELRGKLQRSRERILQHARDLRELTDKVARLPLLEEKLRRFKEAKVEEQLREKRVLQREKRILATLDERLAAANEALAAWRDTFPIDTAFAGPEALVELPHAVVLAKATPILTSLNEVAAQATKNLTEATVSAAGQAAELRKEWQTYEDQASERYNKTLRELQKQGIDGQEFIKLEEDYAKTQKSKKDLERLSTLLADLHKERSGLLVEWNRLTNNEFLSLARTAKTLNRKIEHVRVEPQAASNRSVLYGLVKGLPGRTAEAAERLRDFPGLTPADLAAACRKGEAELQAKYQLTPSGARALVEGGEETWMKIEELELGHGTEVQLNVTPEAAAATWKAIDELSTGQKATAILLLLLAENAHPLLIDQPEDDLDNRFITDVVVERMRESKNSRQFIFATHNANIPVLGDAELVIGVEGLRDDRGEIGVETLGSIDRIKVQDLIQRVLEGGRSAFERRREKYGLAD